MAFGITHYFAGGTREQYEAVRRTVHPDDGRGLPEGQIHHFAGSTGDGWLVVVIWDSRETYEGFRDATLMPGLQSLGDAGFGGPPEARTFEVDNEQHA